MSDDYSLNLRQLAELFPDMDSEVVDMVLRDSAGALDPAVNVLLSMNDPDFKPEERDVSRQKEVQLDAEYARRLAETEIAARSNNNNRGSSRARSASASSNARGTPPPPPQQPSHSPAAASSPSSSSSKIRSMLRFGRRSAQHQSPQPQPPIGSAPSAPLRVRNAANSEALESDFSDASDSGPPSLRDDSNVVRREADLLGLLDDSSPDVLASSYAPLSPARAAPAPSRAAPARAAGIDEGGAVDMDDPFAVHFDSLAPPLPPLPAAAVSDNDDDEALGDTNPFRARRQMGTTPPP
ncbi:hypothetical protein GGF42_002778 [Coemansia sp. RSA 2424]|nr:hypothetical protein GGF42_002778 [Coemansia sp. RSA 2424]